MPDSGIDRAIEQVLSLQPGVVGTGSDRHERPHKPLLVLSAIDLLDAGEATPDRIPWSKTLWDRFALHFENVRSHDDQCNPDLPFYHLKTDGFWQALSDSPEQAEQSLEAPPLKRDGGTVSGRFSPEVAEVLSDPFQRAQLRAAVISRFFPGKFDAPDAANEEDELARVAETTLESGYTRSNSFRKKVVTEYDHQCAACGLRIKLPETSGNFVEAAHLIPFSQSHSDHPTNGIALCQNHHWAMDRHLIAPGPDHLWHTSAILDPRRSNGEAALQELRGLKILLPAEEAYHPSVVALEWRIAALQSA